MTKAIVPMEQFMDRRVEIRLNNGKEFFGQLLGADANGVLLRSDEDSFRYFPYSTIEFIHRTEK